MGTLVVLCMCVCMHTTHATKGFYMIFLIKNCIVQSMDHSPSEKIYYELLNFFKKEHNICHQL